MSQKAQVGPVGVSIVPPERQHVQLSRLRCWDFSWRCQSCFVANVQSAQNVHWNRRSLVLGLGALVGLPRRRRRSRVPT